MSPLRNDAPAMAKAKNESTAINELIQLAASRGASVQDPSDDLMFAPPKPEPKRTRKSRAAIDVPASEPMDALPRARAPQGTAQHVPVVEQTLDADAIAIARTTTSRSLEPRRPPNPTVLGAMPATPRAPALSARVSNPTVLGAPVPPREPADLFQASAFDTDVQPRTVTPPPLPRTSTPPASTTLGVSPLARASSASIAPPPIPSRASSAAIAVPPALAPRTSSAAITVPPPFPSRTSSAAIAVPPPFSSRASAAAIVVPPSLDIADEPAPARVATPTAQGQAPAPRPTMLGVAPLVAPPSVVIARSSVGHDVPTADELDAPTTIQGSSPVEVQPVRAHRAPTDTFVHARRRTAGIKLSQVAPWMALVIAGGAVLGAYIASNQRKAPDAPVAGLERATPTERAAIGDRAALVVPPSAPAVAVEPAAVAPTPSVVPPPSAPTPSVPTAPPSPAPIAAEPSAVSAPVAVALVDVRIDSEPSGATVTLLDRGQELYLGTTPLRTALDPSRTHQVELSHPRRPSERAIIDPSATKRVTIELERRSRSASKATPPAPAPKVATAPTTPKAAPTPTRAAATKPSAPAPTVVKTAAKTAPATTGKASTETAPPPAPAPTKLAATEAKAAVATAPAGDGVLMISSKPPCEIIIDGKATGLTTPQRSLPLEIGAHKVTLVNNQHNVKKTLSVEIKADKPTKVIENFLK